jgi:hypothetical protein
MSSWEYAVTSTSRETTTVANIILSPRVFIFFSLQS